MRAKPSFIKFTLIVSSGMCNLVPPLEVVSVAKPPIFELLQARLSPLDLVSGGAPGTLGLLVGDLSPWQRLLTRAAEAQLVVKGEKGRSEDGEWKPLTLDASSSSTRRVWLWSCHLKWWDSASNDPKSGTPLALMALETERLSKLHSIANEFTTRASKEREGCIVEGVAGCIAIWQLLTHESLWPRAHHPWQTSNEWPRSDISAEDLWPRYLRWRSDSAEGLVPGLFPFRSYLPMCLLTFGWMVFGGFAWICCQIV